MDDIVYFEVDNWFAGRDYPEAEPFLSWMANDLSLQLKNDEWVKENKLVVACCFVDMSQAFAVSAPRKWVEKICPVILEDQNKKFVFHPDENGKVVGKFLEFMEYNEENIGVHWLDDYEFLDDYDAFRFEDYEE